MLLRHCLEDAFLTSSWSLRKVVGLQAQVAWSKRWLQNVTTVEWNWRARSRYVHFIRSFAFIRIFGIAISWSHAQQGTIIFKNVQHHERRVTTNTSDVSINERSDNKKIAAGRTGANNDHVPMSAPSCRLEVQSEITRTLRKTETRTDDTFYSARSGPPRIIWSKQTLFGLLFNISLFSQSIEKNGEAGWKEIHYKTQITKDLSGKKTERETRLIIEEDGLRPKKLFRFQFFKIWLTSFLWQKISGRTPVYLWPQRRLSPRRNRTTKNRKTVNKKILSLCYEAAKQTTPVLFFFKPNAFSGPDNILFIASLTGGFTTIPRDSGHGKLLNQKARYIRASGGHQWKEWIRCRKTDTTRKTKTYSPPRLRKKQVCRGTQSNIDITENGCFRSKHEKPLTWWRSIVMTKQARCVTWLKNTDFCFQRQLVFGERAVRWSQQARSLSRTP